GRRAAVAEGENGAADLQPLADRGGRGDDPPRLSARDTFAQRLVVACLHLDRRRGLGDHRVRVLLLLSEERIEERGSPHLMAALAVLEEDMYGLPERVIEDLEDLLVDVGIVRRRGDRIAGVSGAS